MPHPRYYAEADPVIERRRQLCLALGEKEAWGECTFRAHGGSMFVMTDNHHHQRGHQAVSIKAPAHRVRPRTRGGARLRASAPGIMVQEILINADPSRFFKPPYLGPKGWVGVRLDDGTNWDELAALLTDGYRLSVRKQPSRPSKPVGRTAKVKR
jgi:predicted DNA-binding protein (MmcQ/YjbR family)